MSAFSSRPRYEHNGQAYVPNAHRLEVLARVIERRLSQRQAAEQLDVSLRKAERLCRRLRRDGAAGLVSRKRGRPSNRATSSATPAHARGFLPHFVRA